MMDDELCLSIIEKGSGKKKREFNKRAEGREEGEEVECVGTGAGEVQPRAESWPVQPLG